jgi:Leucine-rich repeat (LRR) protein
VPTIRDIGTGYKNLTILWIPRCELASLEGLGSLNSIRELYLAFNKLTEIDVLGQLENLEILDLES